MSTEIDVPEARVGAVLSDISSVRRGTVEHFDVNMDDAESQDGPLQKERISTVEAKVPLAQLVGYVSKRSLSHSSKNSLEVSSGVRYSSALRTLTAGEASFSTEFHSYQPLPANAQEEMARSGTFQ